MSSLLVHDMDTAWTSSAPAVLQVAIDTQTFVGASAASNRLVAQAGAVNASAELVPATPLDLRDYDEWRFWVLGNRAAHGTTVRPFYLEFSYTDAGDTPDDIHRWFVPINQVGRWEQRRIGIQNDRRSAITQLRWTCLTALPFVCNIDELLAVREEMLADLEQALTQWLDHQAILPGVTNVRLNQTATPCVTQIVLPITPGFNAGNRLLLRGGSAGDEIHHVVGVTHNVEAGSTTLDIDPAAAVVGTLTADVATASVMVPVIVETLPLPTSNPTPAIIVTQLEAREDLERTGYSILRDSFRQRGALTVCSVRPGARAYVVEYQSIAVAPERVQMRQGTFAADGTLTLSPPVPVAARVQFRLPFAVPLAGAALLLRHRNDTNKWQFKHFNLTTQSFPATNLSDVTTTELDLHAAADGENNTWVACRTTDGKIQALEVPRAGVPRKEMPLDSGAPNHEPFVLVANDFVWVLWGGKDHIISH